MKIYITSNLKNQEKAKMIADQCKPCSADFYRGIKQGVLLALNAEKENLSKAEKWDSLDEKIISFYADKNENDFCLDSIGEVAAHAFGWM